MAPRGVAGGKPRRPIPSTRRVRPGGKEEVSVDGFLTGRSSPFFISLSDDEERQVYVMPNGGVQMRNEE